MTESTALPVLGEERMREILDMLLERDDDITARAVARLHPSLKAASSFTRSKSRSKLLAEYQHRQNKYRHWRGRVGKRSGQQTAAAIADKDIRIANLESPVALLTVSHLALLRTVGELGGFAKWSSFYEHYRDARAKLNEMGVVS
jgi:hypothetical protein